MISREKLARRRRGEYDDREDLVLYTCGLLYVPTPRKLRGYSTVSNTLFSSAVIRLDIIKALVCSLACPNLHFKQAGTLR